MRSARVQRVFMAGVLGMSLVFFNLGALFIANIVLGFVIFMILVWAVFDVCPSLWVFKGLIDDAAHEFDAPEVKSATKKVS